MTLIDILSDIFLPISLAIIMLGMGMTLTIKDFARIVKYPKSILTGLINQIILLPLTGFLLSVFFGLSPLMAVGLVILASCPGGPTSNLITQICRGNIALSVSLTACSSFISVITIPYILSFVLNYFGTGLGITIQLPILETIIKITGITIVPISIGMIIRKLNSAFASKMERPMRIASTVIFIAVFIFAIVINFDLLGKAMIEVGLVSLLLNVIALSLGFLTSYWLKLDRKTITTISIESGIQNGALAFVITTSILENAEMSLPTAAYVIWMYVTSGILMYVLPRKMRVQ